LVIIFHIFCLDHHLEKEVAAASRCNSHRAGIRMDYAKINREFLAEAVLLNMGKKVNCPSMPINEAQNAALFMNQVLLKKS
jgi:hypothetical protein